MTSPDSVLNKDKVSELKQADSRLTEILTRHQQRSALHTAKVEAVASQLTAILDNQFGIDRTITIGHIGRRTPTTTALPKRCTDLDLIAFFNFSDLSQERLQDLISKLPSIIVDRIKSYQVLFTATAFPSAGMLKVVNTSTQVVIDVYVAVNLARDPEVQWKEVLYRHLKSAGSLNLNYLKTSHLEMVKMYMLKAREDPFVEQVVQLAQIWNEKCAENLGLILHQIPGRNRIMELVAIRAAQMETQLNKKNRRSLTSAFQLFLLYLRTPHRNLRIVFQQGVKLPQSCQAKFEARTKEVGILLDPVNPYVNYLENLGLKSQWPGIQGAADISLNCLELVRKGKKSIEELLGLGHLEDKKVLHILK